MNLRFTRRKFLKACLPVAGVAYPFVEACRLRKVSVTVQIPNLPVPFKGFRIAFAADFHHGPVTGSGCIRKTVRMVNSLDADLIALGGDYVLASKVYIDPCFDALKELHAPLGVYAVLGNHDHWTDPARTHERIQECGFTDLTNGGRWIEKNGARLRLAGVGDLWEDKQDLAAALGDATEEDACILLSHNPDYTEIVEDRRVGLILSGHTHKGQVVLPFYGAPLVPSTYGQKYLHGLVKTPFTQVYITRGVATIYPPVRFCASPEVVLVSLA